MRDTASLDPPFGEPELVILCTPVGLLGTILGELGALLEKGTLVTDVLAATKRSVVAAAEQSLPKDIHFVGSHPMAGSEKRGVQHAKGDLYEGALCILTPTTKDGCGGTKTGGKLLANTRDANVQNFAGRSRSAAGGREPSPARPGGGTGQLAG